MAKFTSSVRQNICARYLRDECITFDDLARCYGVSRSTISNAIHKAIAECEISEKDALRIMEKAVANVQRKLHEMNKKGSAKKTIEKFENSLEKARLKREREQEVQEDKEEEIKDLKIHLEEIESIIVLLQDRIATFDDTFSSSDEYGVTKECLQEQLDKQLQRKHDFEAMLEVLESK